MKIALFGKGKTGGAFLELAKGKHEVEVYSRSRPASLELLKRADAAVVFVPPSGMADIAPLLLEAGVPVVSGTTGFDYGSLPAPKAPWITASNFSLGMNLTFVLTRLLSGLGRMAQVDYQVSEVHHTEKKDSPSGTALTLLSLLPKETPVQAERIGDAKGTHRVVARLRGEVIRLEHEALDRSVFGAGALFAAEELLPGLAPGLHRFENLMEEKLRKELSHG